MEDKFIIKLLDRRTLKQQVEVYMRSFNVKESVNSVIEKWKSEHYENPVHEAYIFGAFDVNKLVSINAYMPMKYEYQGKECNVIQSCVSGTIPEYRGKGIWSKLVRYALDYFKKEGIYDFLIGFPNYKTSYGGFIKMKWAHDSDAINYLMIVNGRQFVKAAINKNVPLSGILGLQQIKINLAGRLNYKIGDMRLIIRKNNEKGFSLVENEKFVEWKKIYKGLEWFGIYTLDGIHIGNCRYFTEDYHGSKIIKLCDIKPFDKTNENTSFYAFCIREIIRRHNDAAFIRVWVMNESPLEKFYKKLLFVKDGKHENPFITYSLKADVVPEEILHNKENWINASFLDLD